jgi:hypothetical protein
MWDIGKMASARISQMLFESKEVRSERTSVMFEVPKTSLKDKVNSTD